MKRLPTMACAIIALGVAHAAEVEWTVSDTTGRDDDVQTEGRCLYAYTPCATRTVVNGVEFERYNTSAADFLGDATLDVAFACVNNGATFLGDTASSWSGTAGYRQLLGSGWYKSVYSEHVNTLTLKGLVPGRRYLVQLWCCDVRNNTFKTHTIKVGDKVGTNGGSGGLYGSNFTGIFTADAMVQTITITYNNESKLNAFQVRSLDEAKIAWTVRPTAGEGDVRADGYPLYAYKAGDPMIVNGMYFAGAAGGTTGWGDDISLSVAAGNAANAFCWMSDAVPGGAYSYSEAYRTFVNAGFYKDHASPLRRLVTLKGLVPGNRYLVQLWVFDNRNADYRTRTVLVDNAAFLAHSDGTAYGHGYHATGLFTATGTEQTFSCTHRSLSSLGSIQEELGPIQVRCLNAPPPGRLFWCKSATALADGSVRTDGAPVFAYAGNAATVNGVNFKKFRDSSTPCGDNADWPSGDLHTTSAFFDSGNGELSANVPEDVQSLLKGGLYMGTSASKTMTLKHLVPGRRYLLQIWASDSRDGRDGWTMSIDGFGTVAYRMGNSPLGENAVATFTAAEETLDIVLANRAGEPHFNAIQLRELDGPDRVGVTFSKSSTDFATGSVRTDGTLVCAYAAQNTTVNGVGFTAFGRGTDAFGQDADWTANTVVYNQKAFANKTNPSTYSLDEVSDSVIAMLSGTYYANGDNISNTLTLKNLQPGRRYLFQIWACDTRTGRDGWSTSLPDYDTLCYQSETAHIGENAVMTFMAMSDTFKVEVVGRNGEPTFNAFQLRLLDDGAGYAWAGGAIGQWGTSGTNWTMGGVAQDAATLWDALSGPTNSASVCEAAAVLALDADVFAATVSGFGSLTIGSAGTDKTLTAAEVVAPTATVNAVWGGQVLRKTCSGTTMLAGACPFLEQVIVSRGTAAFATVPALPVDAFVYAPGILKLEAGAALDVRSITGDGMLKGPGRCVLSSGGTVAAPRGLAYADGFAWCVANGTALAFATASDANDFPILTGRPRPFQVSRQASRCLRLTMTDGRLYGTRNFQDGRSSKVVSY